MQDSFHLQRLFEGLERYKDIFDRVSPYQLKKAESFLKTAQQQLQHLQRLDFSRFMAEASHALHAFDAQTVARTLQASETIFERICSLPDTFSAFDFQQIAELAQHFDSISQRFIADSVAVKVAFQEINSNGLLDRIFTEIQENADTVDAFKSAGWPLAPSMAIELKRRITLLHKNGKTRYISQVIMGYYRRKNHINLIRCVDAWKENPLFLPRMHILHDALTAHCHGQYTLSTPAAMPQIEGILNDYVHTNNLAAKLGKISQVYHAVLGDLGEVSLSTWAITTVLLYQLQTNTYTYASFEEELNKVMSRRKTTRHTILHGITTTYHKPSTSLRVFLLLDAISVLNMTDE